MLPKCVKIDASDDRSAKTLISDGWREIGTIVDYFGNMVVGRTWSAVKDVPKGQREHVISLAARIEWSGRLWRDENIKRDVAMEETNRFLRSADRVLVVEGRALLVPSEDRILLIGVDPAFSGLRVAENLIRHWCETEKTQDIFAGTYSDNIRARALYAQLDMRHDDFCDKRVFHK